MLEDMDKKSSSRSVQGPLKGNGTEPKKLDVPPVSKQQPRSRKREPPNSNGSKFEQGKKPIPQKTKSLDKRPRSRGYYCGGRKEETQIDSLEDDLGLEFAEGKRRNLNHLLNFHYEQHRVLGSPSVSCAPRSVVSNSTKALMATRTHKYNKEHFLQANCQFIVRSSGDYSSYLGDPDLLVDWDQIELIRVPSIEIVNCPICLYPPTAGKITRCGHIFCWACILHYLALSDKSWRKCPICYEAVHKDNLKSVECSQRPQYATGSKIKMRLMKREKGTLIASPVTQYGQRISKSLLSISESVLDTNYSKLLLADINDVNNIMDKEWVDLDMQLKEFAGTPELCFVEEAMELLAQRATTSKENFNTNTTKSPSFVAEGVDSPIKNIPEEGSTEEPVNLKSDEGSKPTDRIQRVSCSSDDNISVKDLYIAPDSSNVTKHFYFYQAEGGDQIFLHAINVRMLEAEYGSLEACPPVIEGVIVELESGSMTHELRNRLRYLQHLPVTAQFDVVEIELGPPFISESIVNQFQDQISIRRKARSKRARQEKRRSKAIEEIERKMIGAGSKAPDLRIESHFHFPECGGNSMSSVSEDSVTRTSSAASSRAGSPAPSRESSLSSALSSLSLEPPPVDTSSGPSFAQMLRESSSISKVGGWPIIGKGKDDRESCWPRKETGVWGSNRRQQAPVASTSADSDPELAAFSPPTKPMFTIADALNLAKEQQSGVTGESNRKKKKKKQKILFVSGMACGGN